MSLDIDASPISADVTLERIVFHIYWWQQTLVTMERIFWLFFKVQCLHKTLR